MTRPFALGIVADVRATLEGLAGLLDERGARHERSRDLERYRELDRTAREAVMDSVSNWSGEGIHPAHVMQAVGDVFGRDAIYNHRWRQHLALCGPDPASDPAALLSQHSPGWGCSEPGFPRHWAPSSRVRTAMWSA